MGKSTLNLEKYFRLVEETPDGIIIPRGFVAEMTLFLGSFIQCIKHIFSIFCSDLKDRNSVS